MSENIVGARSFIGRMLHQRRQHIIDSTTAAANRFSWPDRWHKIPQMVRPVLFTEVDPRASVNGDRLAIKASTFSSSAWSLPDRRCTGMPSDSHEKYAI